MLLRSLVISVCEYNPLCSQIPVDKCLQFDRFLHTKDIKNTKYIVTQPSHATFLSRYHHDLHITSLLPTQLQGRAGNLMCVWTHRTWNNPFPPPPSCTSCINGWHIPSTPQSNPWFNCESGTVWDPLPWCRRTSNHKYTSASTTQSSRQHPSQIA